MEKEAREYGRFKNAIGQPVRFDLIMPDRSTYDQKPPVLTYIHGIGSSLDAPATLQSYQSVLDLGIAVYRFDATPVKIRKNGAFDFKAETRDLSPHTYIQTIHHAFRNLEERCADTVDMNHLSLHCTSLGSYCGSWYAAHMNGLQKRVLTEDPYPITSMILQSPVPEPLGPFKKYADNRLLNRIWKAMGYFPWIIGGEWTDVSYKIYEESHDVDFIADIAPHITVPVDIHYGTKDELASQETIERIKPAMAQSPEVNMFAYQNAGHALQRKDVLDELPKELLDRYARKTGRKLYTKTDLLIHYMLGNFGDSTYGPEAIGRGCEFLRRNAMPRLISA